MAIITLNELILDGREQKALNLLDHGIFPLKDIIKQDAYMNTPLHWAAKLGCPSLIKALARQGALRCKSMRNDKDKIPYDYAVENSLSYEILDLLAPNPSTSTNDQSFNLNEKIA